jgi:predicted metal-dependent phosphoesterase TrpH
MISVEMHVHSTASDGKLRPTEVAAICRVSGIDRIAITDHNTVSGAQEAQRLAPELVIVGEEIQTTQGELLAYFVTDEVPAGLPPQEVIARLHAQGAVVCVPHPFDRWRGGAWREEDLEAIRSLIDAIEVFNPRVVFPGDNARALAFASRHGVLCSVGSDAHKTKEIGQAILRMPQNPASGAELLAGLAQAEMVYRPMPPLAHIRNMVVWTAREAVRAGRYYLLGDGEQSDG